MMIIALYRLASPADLSASDLRAAAQERPLAIAYRARLLRQASGVDALYDPGSQQLGVAWGGNVTWVKVEDATDAIEAAIAAVLGADILLRSAHTAIASIVDSLGFQADLIDVERVSGYNCPLLWVSVRQEPLCDGRRDDETEGRIMRAVGVRGVVSEGQGEFGPNARRSRMVFLVALESVFTLGLEEYPERRLDFAPFQLAAQAFESGARGRLPWDVWGVAAEERDCGYTTMDRHGSVRPRAAYLPDWNGDIATLGKYNLPTTMGNYGAVALDMIVRREDPTVMVLRPDDSAWRDEITRTGPLSRDMGPPRDWWPMELWMAGVHPRER